MIDRKATARTALTDMLKEGQTVYTITHTYKRGKAYISVYVASGDVIKNITGFCCMAFDTHMTDEGYIPFANHAPALVEQLAIWLFEGSARALRHVDLD